MKIILTESQIGRIIEQSNGCPPRRPTKPVVDSILPAFKNELLNSIKTLQGSLAKKITSGGATDKKLVSLFNEAVSENFNLLYGIGVKSAYANYGLSGPYNQTADVQALVNNLIDKVISTIDSNFVYRQALKAYINKNNIRQIKEGFSDVLLMSFRELNKLLLRSEYGLTNMVEEKMGKCPNGEYNVPYNKNATTEYRVITYFPTKITGLNKKLDTFV